MDLCAPYFRNGQSICLLNPPLGAALQFRQQLHAANPNLRLNILELGKLFDCAKVERDVLLIIGQRKKVNICGCSRNQTRHGLPFAGALVKGLLSTVLGGRTCELTNFSQVLTPAILNVVEGLDTDIQNLARAYKCVVPKIKQALFAYGLGDHEKSNFGDLSLEQALRGMGQSLLGPNLIDHSHKEPLSDQCCLNVIKRDVSETLVLLLDFARVARIQLPVINSIVELASAVTCSELMRHGRKVSDLGLIGYDVSEIIELINN
jgi:hypothetical protein